jgi:lipopolysaccharide export system ATP-binding protein
MLDVIDIDKSFKRKMVIKNVSLKSYEGEIIALLGANGAGKTTIFHILTGLIRAGSGYIMLDGRDISKEPMYKRARLGISYLPQKSSVLKKMTVEENILTVLEVLDLSRKERKVQLHHFLKVLNIAHLAKHKASSLSGGEKRRVEVTRALVLSPRFILLDEPFAGIDPLAIIDIQKIIFDLRRKNVGVIITDHNVREALQVCDRIYVINNGEIIENGTPEEITDSGKVRKFYLGEDFVYPFRKREVLLNKNAGGMNHAK